MENETPEQEARRLRNIIFVDFHGPIQDDKWANMKDNWITDIEWLREKANQPLKLSAETKEITEKKSEKPKSNIIEKVI